MYKRRKFSKKSGNKFGGVRRKRRLVLRGRGDYKSFFKGLWNKAKDFGKGMWGVVKQPLIDVAKTGLRAAPMLLGAGDYRGKNMYGLGLKYTANIPQMHNGPDGSLRIRHRELIVEDLINPPAEDGQTWDGRFNKAFMKTNDGQASIGDNGKFYINPGNKKLFPWLSQIASSFGYFKMHGMAFEFRSTSAVSTVSQSIGSVVLMTELDIYRPEPKIDVSTNSLKAAVCAQQYVNMGKPSETFLHGIECARHLSQTTLYTVRQGVPILENPGDKVALRGDERLSYLGYTIVYIGGVKVDPPTYENQPSLGDLYVTYDIELFRPILSNPLTLSSSTNASTSAFIEKEQSRAACVSTDTEDKINQPFGLFDKSAAPFQFTSNQFNIQPTYGLLLGPNPGKLNPETVNGFSFPYTGEYQLFTVSMSWVGNVENAKTCNPGKFYAYGGTKFLRAYEHKTEWYEGNANEENQHRLRIDFVIQCLPQQENGFYTKGIDMVLPCANNSPEESGCSFELIIQHAAQWWDGHAVSSNILQFD